MNIVIIISMIDGIIFYIPNICKLDKMVLRYSACDFLVSCTTLEKIFFDTVNNWLTHCHIYILCGFLS